MFSVCDVARPGTGAENGVEPVHRWLPPADFLTHRCGGEGLQLHVRRLREKLPILVTNIETIKQFGYRLASYVPPLPPKTT